MASVTASAAGTPIWKALGLLDSYVGEITIPGVLAAGFGISSDIDLLNVAQTAMVGLGMLGSLTGAIGSMLQGGPTNISNKNLWDWSETTRRGSGLSALINNELSSGKSVSAVIGVGSGSGSDVQSASLTSASDSAYDNAGVSSEDIEKGKEIPEISDEPLCQILL